MTFLNIIAASVNDAFGSPVSSSGRLVGRSDAGHAQTVR
jgi:hypothetical protein